jgi:hypothetical protein
MKVVEKRKEKGYVKKRDMKMEARSILSSRSYVPFIRPGSNDRTATRLREKNDTSQHMSVRPCHKSSPK